MVWTCCIMLKYFYWSGGILCKRRHVLSSNCITVSEQHNLINKTSPAQLLSLPCLAGVPTHLAIIWKQSGARRSQRRPTEVWEMTSADKKHSCLMGGISEISQRTEMCSLAQTARLATDKVCLHYVVHYINRSALLQSNLSVISPTDFQGNLGPHSGRAQPGGAATYWRISVQRLREKI